MVKPLEELLGTPVNKIDTIIGPEAEAAASQLSKGEILLLENTRFDIGETKNDKTLTESRQL